MIKVGLLLPSQHRIKDGIMERLDLDLIAQQAGNGVLDVFSYSTYVLDLVKLLISVSQMLLETRSKGKSH